MDAKRRAELYAEICMFEDHEDSLSVPIADLRELLADSKALERVNDVGAICLDRSKEMSQSAGYGRGFSDAMEECRERLRKALGRD